MPILSTDASTALRRKTATSPAVYAISASPIDTPMFVAPRALKITGALAVYTVVAVGGPTAINIGSPATAAAYAVITASATQAAETSVKSTAAQLTGLTVPADTLVMVGSAAGTSGNYFVVIEWEPIEQDILT